MTDSQATDKYLKLRTRLSNYGHGNWAGKTTTTLDQQLDIAQACVDALDEMDRLERERSEWAGIAATRNRNIAMIADERDQWREKCYLIYELITGQHRTTMQRPDVPKALADYRHHNGEIDFANGDRVRACNGWWMADRKGGESTKHNTPREAEEALRPAGTRGSATHD